MLVNSIGLKVLQLIRLDPDDTQRLECLSTIKTMADDLASSLPFCFQSFQAAKNPVHQDSVTLNKEEDLKKSMAELIAWPLTTVSSLADLDVEQELWFRMQLASFGRTIGDRVLEFDKADQWLQL